MIAHIGRIEQSFFSHAPIDITIPVASPGIASVIRLRLRYRTWSSDCTASVTYDGAGSIRIYIDNIHNNANRERIIADVLTIAAGAITDEVGQ